MKSKLFKVLGVVAVIAMLATALVAPVAAVSAVTASVTSATAYINANGNYSIFATTATQLAAGDTITVTFPAGYVISAPTATIAATSGWVGSPPVYLPAVVAGTTWSFSGQTIVATLVTGAQIGAGAQVLINITAGAANPPTAGSYTLNVATSQETTAVTSNAITIGNPVLTPLPGVATVYNTAGILVSQSNSLATAETAIASYAGGVIKLTAGTYTDAISSNVSFTLQGTDASAANVIIKATAPWTLNGATVVVDKVTIDGSGFVAPATNGDLTLSATTAGTISNSILQGGAVTLGGVANTFSNDTVTVLTGATGVVANTATTLTNCTFSVAGTGIGISNVGATNVTVTGCAFTGVTGGGWGIDLNGGTGSVVGTSKFSGLTEALDITAAAVSFNGNTVDKCGVATTGPDAIMVHSTVAPGVQISTNKITNSLENIMTVTVNDTMVWVMGNSFSGNVGNVVNNTAVPMTGGMNVTHNYWGGAAANPASTTSVSYAMPLGSAPTNGNVSVGAATSLDASATAGVIITSATNTELGAVMLGANPVSVALPSTVTVKGYYDVFGVGTATANLQFNGSTAKPITAADDVYMWNTVYGRWDDLGATTVPMAVANAFGNNVTVTGANITGSIFALVTILPTVPPVTPDVTPQYPGSGATDVPVNVTFTWPAVTGATGYQFAIAQDNPDLANKFAVLDYSANTITNAHIVQETLLPNTTYWWEVRSVAGTVYSAWTIQSFFTTAKAPVVTSTTTAPPITIVQTTVTYTNPPVTTITYTLPQPKETQPIPSYLLWAVIAVGAVLVIAVIVLIVRTRRMS
jgi:hypothetical protein